MRVTARLRFFLPQFEKLAALPAPPGFHRPLAHHVFVLARPDHLTSDLGTKNQVVAHAARLAVVVHQIVTAGHALEKVLVADLALPGEDFRQLKGVVSGLLVIFGLSLVVRLWLLGHGSLSQHRRPPSVLSPVPHDSDAISYFVISPSTVGWSFLRIPCSARKLDA